MKKLFFITAGLTILFSSLSQADELVTDNYRKQEIYRRVFNDVISAPFVCLSGAVLEFSRSPETERRITIGYKKDEKYVEGVNVWLHSDSSATELRLNHGEQPIIVVSNYFRNNYLDRSGLLEKRPMNGDALTQTYFTTTEDFKHVTRIQIDYVVYKLVDTGTLIDPSTELQEIRPDYLMDCSRP